MTREVELIDQFDWCESCGEKFKKSDLCNNCYYCSDCCYCNYDAEMITQWES